MAVIVVNEVIKKIINMEEKAQQIIDSARNEEASINKNLQDDINKMEEEIVFKQKRKISQLTEHELNEAKNEALKNEQETKEKISKMEEYADKNIENWCKELVTSIIKR